MADFLRFPRQMPLSDILFGAEQWPVSPSGIAEDAILDSVLLAFNHHLTRRVRRLSVVWTLVRFSTKFTPLVVSERLHRV